MCLAGFRIPAKTKYSVSVRDLIFRIINLYNNIANILDRNNCFIKQFVRMIETLNEINSYRGFTQRSDLKLQVKFDDAHLLGISSSKSLRMIIFKSRQTGKQFIGNHPSEILPNILYIIPPFHLYYLPKHITGYISLEFHKDLLIHSQKLWLNNISYKQEKNIEIRPNINEIETFTFFKNLMEKENGEKEVLSYFANYVFSQNKELLGRSQQYLSEAEKFLSLLYNTNLKHTDISVTSFCRKLCIERSKLLRVCNLIFGSSPNIIISQHFLAKIIFYILRFKDEKLDNISELLGFSDFSAFSRFVKNASGSSPKEIRSLYIDYL